MVVIFLQPPPDSSEGHTAGSSIGVAINSSRNTGESNASQAALTEQSEAVGVAFGEDLRVFTLRSHCGDDIPVINENQDKKIPLKPYLAGR